MTIDTPSPCLPPAWVSWIAQDSNGVWWGYSVEPLRNETGWYENELGRHVRLGESEPLDWERSLKSIRKQIVK